MDRRTRFFLIAALACFLVAPVGLAEYREVAVVVGAVYIVLAIASFADHAGRRR